MAKAIFMRPLPAAVLSATNVLAGYDKANLLTDYLGVVLKQQSSGAASQSFILDLGADLAIDTIALIGLTGAKATWTMQVSAATEAQGAFTGASHAYAAVDLLAGAVLPASQRGRAYWEKPSGGPAAARYWRVTISTPANNTAITVGRVAIGQRIRPERSFDFGAAFGLRDTGKSDRSPRGVLLRRRGAKFRSVGLSFAHLHQDEVEKAVQPLIEEVGATEPVLLVTNTDPHEQRQNRIYFGELVGDLGTIWAKANAGFQCQANIVDLEAFTDVPARVTTPTPTPTPTPAPSPFITPATGPWKVGDTLTGHDGAAPGDTISARQWTRDNTAISGANGGTYVLTSDDFPALMRFSATGQGGTGTSPPVGPVIDVPAAFTSGMWALVDTATGGTLAVTVSSLPPANGASITDVEYTLDAGGAWLSGGGVVDFDISGLTDGTAQAVQLRAVNSAGAGPSSDIKSATPTGAIVATLIYDATAKQFVVTNAASFPGAVWAWEDETGATIAGQTGSTLALAAAPAGRYVQAIPDGATASASNFALAPVVLDDFAEEFAGADGTILDGYNGWQAWTNWQDAARASNILALQGGDLYQSALIDGSTWWRHLASAVEKRVDLIGFRNPLGATLNQQAERAIYMDTSWVAGKKNEISLSLNNASGLLLSKNVGGTSTTLFNISNSTIGKNDVALARINGRAHVYVDGVELAQSIAAGGYDVSDVPVSGYVGLGGFGGAAPAQPYKILDRFVVTKSPLVVFLTSSITFSSGALTASGTCTTSVTNYDWALIGSDGKVWKDWTNNVPVSGSGTWGISGVAIPAELEGHPVLLAMRPSSNKANLILLDCGVAPITPVIGAYSHGVNEHYVSSDTTMRRERNLFGRSNFRTPEVSTRINEPWGYLEDFDFAVTGFDETGQYLHWPPGVTYGLLSLGRGAKAGIYDITYPASMPVASFEMGQMVNVNVISTPSGGTARIEILQDYVYTCLLRVGGIIPAGTSIGSATIQCFEIGETDKTSYLSEPFKTHMTAGKYRSYRNMPQDLDGPKFTGLVNRGNNAVGLLCPKAWGEISRLNGGTNLQPCIPHLADETWIEDYAAALRDEGNIHPDALIRPENSNEGWNYAGAYVKQFDWHIFEGCKRGYFSATGPFVPISGLLRSLQSDGDTYVDRYTAQLKLPLNPGDQLLWAKNGTGYLLVKTDIARSVGDPVPLVSGSGWTLIADNAATGLAQRRMYSERTELIVDIFDSVFGAAKIQPVVAWQHAAGFAGAKPILDFGNLRQKMIGRGTLMTAPYWGPAFGDLTGAFPGSNTPYAGWGPTQRALLTSNPTAFIDAFFAAAPAVIDAMVNSDVTYRNNLDQDLVNNGYLPGSIVKGSYEIFWEVRFPSSWPAAIKAVYGQIIRDARMGTLTTKQASRTRAEISGPQMYFTRGDRIPTDFISNLMMYWGMAENEFDIGPDNARWTALAAVGAGA